MTKILVIEDDESIRLGLVDTLKAKGYEVEATTRGDVGLERALQVQPDLIVLDIMLPDMDGFEVLRTLKKREFNIKVLALTMHKTAEFIKNIIKAGADGYLQKDTGKETLIQAIVQLHDKGSYYTPEVATLMLDDLRGLNQNSNISPRE